jgi:hypothetical protein
MAAQANHLEVFLHAHVERSSAELRPQKADSRDRLAALLGTDGPARGGLQIRWRIWRSWFVGNGEPWIMVMAESVA